MNQDTFRVVQAFLAAEGINATEAEAKQNLIEILTVMDAKKKCLSCLGIDHCRMLVGTHGYEMSLIREKNGWFSIGYNQCEMTGKKSEKRIPGSRGADRSIGREIQPLF